MVKTIYKPPQVAEDDELEASVVKYMSDYRRIYIEHPRVRYDGVYIAVCHYMYVLRLQMLFSFIEEYGKYASQPQWYGRERLGQRVYPATITEN